MKTKVNISGEEILAQQNKFKLNASFTPYKVSDADKDRVMQHVRDLVKVQNGSDTDDYVLGEPTKLQKYLPHLEKGTKILFLGTGCGREVADALEQGFDAYGTTLGSMNTQFAREQLGLPPDRVVECLNEALPFASDFFDVVVGFQVFEHAFSPMMFLLEQRRVLKLTGTLLLEWPPAMNYTMGSDPHHFLCYTPGQAKALFEKAGFVDILAGYVFGGKINPVPDNKMWDGTGTFDVQVGEELQTIETHLCIRGAKYHNSNWTAR